MHETLTVEKLPSGKKYVIPKTVLVTNSGYFAKATSGDWVEAKTKQHTLEEVNVQAFEIYVRWLHNGRVEFVNTNTTDQLLIHAWALGDRLQSSKFKIHIVNALVWDWQPRRDDYPCLVTLNLVYQVAPAGSALRRLAIQKWSIHVREDFDDEREDMEEALPADLEADLGRAMRELIQSIAGDDSDSEDIIRQMQGDIDHGNICAEYHDHGVNEAACTAEDIKDTFVAYNNNRITSEFDARAPALAGGLHGLLKVNSQV